MTVHFASNMVYTEIFFSEKITVPDFFVVVVNSLESANKQSQDSDNK